MNFRASFERAASKAVERNVRPLRAHRELPQLDQLGCGWRAQPIDLLAQLDCFRDAALTLANHRKRLERRHAGSRLRHDLLQERHGARPLWPPC